jgi:hypothetical protein
MSSSDRERYGYFVDPKYSGDSRTQYGDLYGEHRARQESFAQLFSDGVNSPLDMDARYPGSNRSQDPPPRFASLSTLMPRTYDAVNLEPKIILVDSTK